jgi:hypothetical protein
MSSSKSIDRSDRGDDTPPDCEGLFVQLIVGEANMNVPTGDAVTIAAVVAGDV